MSKPGEDSVYANKFAIMQKQIDEKDKRIKELEEENTQLEAIKNDAIRRYNFESISKQKIKDKIEEIEKEYNEIMSEYGNIDTDVIINIPNKNVRKYLDKLVIKISTLQELLEDK